MQITHNDTMVCSILVYNGSLSILYNTTFEEKTLYTVTFESTVSLLYYLSVAYYSHIHQRYDLDNNQLEVLNGEDDFSYLNLLSILLDADIDNWRSLFKTLANAVQLNVM